MNSPIRIAPLHLKDSSVTKGSSRPYKDPPIHEKPHALRIVGTDMKLRGISSAQVVDARVGGGIA
jgi:hypothetical protein